MNAEQPIKKTRFRKLRLWIEDKAPVLIVGGLLMTITIAFFLDNMVITIKSGETGVLYRRFHSGTVTQYVYPEKVHFILPWNKMYIYTTRVQTVKHELTVLTNKGLPLTLFLNIRYRPDYDMLGMLHKRIGPDYVNRTLLPEIESVLRKRLGQIDPEDVYTNKMGVLTKIMFIAIEEMISHHVIVEDIIIRKIQLPEKIRNAIENKLVEQQILETYIYKLKVEEQEAKRKGIEAKGIKDYQKIIAETLSDKLIKWQGVQATLKLAESENAKVVIIGGGKDGIPVILGNN